MIVNNNTLNILLRENSSYSEMFWKWLSILAPNSPSIGLWECLAKVWALVQPPALRISARVRPVWAPYEVDAGLALLPENVPSCVNS